MSENDKKLEELFGSHAPGPAEHSATDAERTVRNPEHKKERKKSSKAAKQAPVPEELEVGKSYTVKIDYRYCCSVWENEEWGDLTKESDPLHYTVTFTVE